MWILQDNTVLTNGLEPRLTRSFVQRLCVEPLLYLGCQVQQRPEQAPPCPVPHEDSPEAGEAGLKHLPST